MTVREWFRGMRHGDDALMFAADVEHALNHDGTPDWSGVSRVHIRSHDVTLIFDLDAYEAWQRKRFFIRRMLDDR